MEIRRWKLLSLLVMAVAILAMLLLTGCGGQEVLTMYVTDGGAEVIIQSFEEATGIKVEYLTMSSSEVLTRLEAEADDPQTDIWFGGEADAFVRAKEAGILEAYQSPNAGSVDPAFRDEEGYWTGVSLGVLGFLVNNNRLAERGLVMPDSWADLADGSYANEIVTSNPNTSSTAYAMVSGILQMRGEEGWAYLDQLYANITIVEQTDAAAGQRTLAGEFAIAIVADPHISVIGNPAAPLSAVYPEDGVLAWPSAVAIVKDAEHTANAQHFVDWCISPEGQTVLMEAAATVPATDVQPVEGVPGSAELNLVAYDMGRWMQEQESVIAAWNARYPQYGGPITIGD